MILDPQGKSGRFVMHLLAEKVTSLRAISDSTTTSREEASDASSKAAVYQLLLDELQGELDARDQAYPHWVTKGKSITQLIMELGSFEDQNLEVRLTFDGGDSHKPVSILTRRDGFCMLENCEW